MDFGLTSQIFVGLKWICLNLFQDEEDTEWILLNDRDEDDDLINEDSQNEEVRHFFTDSNTGAQNYRSTQPPTLRAFGGAIFAAQFFCIFNVAKILPLQTKPKN